MDFDVWVEPSPDNAARVVRALRSFGAPMHGVTEHDLSRPGVGLHIGVPPVRIDILTEISGIAFEAAWPNRLRARFGDHDCFIISPQDMLTNKRAAGRAKDAADAAELEAILSRKK